MTTPASDREIDLSCDLGEAFGPWSSGEDSAALPLISSAHVACGFHAGDSLTMLRTVREAVRQGVSVGAHPGLPDLLGFGRRKMDVTPDALHAYILHQVGALRGVLSTTDASLSHVKLHGAMCLNVEASSEHAAAAAEAIAASAPGLPVFWRASPSPDTFVHELRSRRIEVVSELYPDLRYAPDGSLSPPHEGTFQSTAQSLAQIERALGDGEVETTAGTRVPLMFSSICVHSDSAQAIASLREIRKHLEAGGFTVKPPSTGQGGDR